MSAPRPDPYAVLGLPRDASQDEINHAYRTLMRRYHPDTSGPGPIPERAAAEILEAYAQLRDLASRHLASQHLASRHLASREPEVPSPSTAAPPATSAEPTAPLAGDPSEPPIRFGPVHWRRA